MTVLNKFLTSFFTFSKLKVIFFYFNRFSSSLFWTLRRRKTKILLTFLIIIFFLELVGCILDAISNLCLPSSSTAMKKVLIATHTLLGTAECVYLPIITRHLLDAADLETVDSVLKGLRFKLEEFVQSFNGTYVRLDFYFSYVPKCNNCLQHCE